MYHQLRVGAFACGLALAACRGGLVSDYVLPAIGTPSDASGLPAPVDLATQTVVVVPAEATASKPDALTAKQP